ISKGSRRPSWSVRRCFRCLRRQRHRGTAVSDEEREFGGLRALLFVRMLRSRVSYAEPRIAQRFSAGKWATFNHASPAGTKEGVCRPAGTRLDTRPLIPALKGWAIIGVG